MLNKLIFYWNITNFISFIKANNPHAIYTVQYRYSRSIYCQPTQILILSTSFKKCSLIHNLTFVTFLYVNWGSCYKFSLYMIYLVTHVFRKILINLKKFTDAPGLADKWNLFLLQTQIHYCRECELCNIK